MQPVEGLVNVIQFAIAVVMFAFAQTRASKVEAQHRESESVERLHRVEHDFVMERSTKEWVGMGDQRGVCGVGRAAVEQGFEASSGAFEKKRLDR